MRYLVMTLVEDPDLGPVETVNHIVTAPSEAWAIANRCTDEERPVIEAAALPLLYFPIDNILYPIEVN